MVNRGILERVSPLWLGITVSGSLLVILLVTETMLGRWGALQIEGEFDTLEAGLECARTIIAGAAEVSTK